VWTVHLEIPAGEYEAMQPAPPAFGPPAGQPAPKVAGEPREGERNLFGTLFPWVEGTVSVSGRTFEKARIRYAGDITYFVSANGLKRPLSLHFDAAGGPAPAGATSLHLHAMPLDPSKAREALAYSVFQAAGVPAPQTAFAEVSLTVPGKYDKELLGLYTVVEGVDARFLADRFGGGKGLLMRPFGIRGIDFLGDQWTAYTGPYRPAREATAEEAKRVIDFARLVVR
jgi:spore coat protein CotH